jgi:hypothetical protein
MKLTPKAALDCLLSLLPIISVTGSDESEGLALLLETVLLPRYRCCCKSIDGDQQLAAFISQKPINNTVVLCFVAIVKKEGEAM